MMESPIFYHTRNERITVSWTFTEDIYEAMSESSWVILFKEGYILTTFREMIHYHNRMLLLTKSGYFVSQ